MHSPPTAFIIWLLKAERTKAEAGAEARRLGVRLDYAEFYWRNVRRQ